MLYPLSYRGLRRIDTTRWLVARRSAWPDDRRDAPVGKILPVPRRSRLLGAFAVLLVVTMLMRSSQNMAQTTFSLLGSDLLGLHATVIGVLAAVTSVVAILTMVTISGRVPTRLARRALVVSMAAMGISFPLIGEARSIWLLMVGLVVLGFGGGLAFPTLITAAGAMADEASSPGARDRPIALVGVALSVSLAVGPFLETGVLAATGANLRATFLAFSLLPFAAVAILLLANGPGRRAQGERGHGDELAQGSGPTAAHAGVPTRDHVTPAARPLLAAEPTTGEVVAVRIPAGEHRPKVSVRKSLADRNFRLALTGELIYAAPFAAIVVFGALLARHQYGLSPAATEIAFGVFFVISFVVRAVLVWQSPIRHKLALYRVAAILTLVGLAVVATGHSFAVLLVAMALLGVPHGLTFPLTMGLVAEGRPRDELASINAHLSASVQAVNLALPLLLGFGIDKIGYRPMFLLLLVPVAGAAIAQLLISRSRAEVKAMPAGTAGSSRRVGAGGSR